MLHFMIDGGLVYDDVVSLVEELKRAGIEANIGVGCVRIHPEEDQVESMKAICAPYKVRVEEGTGNSTQETLSLIGLYERTGRKIHLDDLK